MTGFVIYRPNDEQMSAYLNGQYVGFANHDEHGWAGMDAFLNTITKIAEVLNLTVETKYEDEPE